MLSASCVTLKTSSGTPARFNDLATSDPFRLIAVIDSRGVTREIVIVEVEC